MSTRTSEAHPLRRTERPRFEEGDDALRVVDLFAGCGGLSLGAAIAANALGRRLDVRLAVDHEEAATTIYSSNFPSAHDVRTASVETLFANGVDAASTDTENGLVRKISDVDLLMGGPPCQGHSNLNNHTRRNDPKNALYLYMVRAAKLFAPKAVMIENVPAVKHDTFNGANVVDVALARLNAFGYQVAEAVVPMVDLGVAQKRKRHIVLATKGDLPAPEAVLKQVMDSAHSPKDLRWAIGDLVDSDGIGWDRAPVASAKNLERMQYLIDHELTDLPNAQRPKRHQGTHSYVSMYGRLSWDSPAQTITSGFGSIGQGRYMHPSEKRALTAHEAARIQGFPDYFDFSPITRRSDLATMIGNAVPPQLAERIVLRVFGADSSSEGQASTAGEPAESDSAPVAD